VRRGVRSWIGVLILLVASSVATNAFADLRTSGTEMACCAKTDYGCAGLSSPDDCCQQMGHTQHGTFAGTLSSAHPVILPAILNVPASEASLVSYDPLNRESGFTRPHDPPHLHSFSLLI
jgi:hypothetical protein